MIENDNISKKFHFNEVDLKKYTLYTHRLDSNFSDAEQIGRKIHINIDSIKLL